MKLSVVIPTYNEENYIKQTIDSVIGAPLPYKIKKEIIVVDDASTDNTPKILSRIQKKYKNIVIIKQKFNQGKGAALKKGFLNTTGDIVIVQDADLEYNPQDYPLLLEPFFERDADVVYGSRFLSYRPHRVLYFWHYVANVTLTLLSNMTTNLNLTDMETGFKVFRGELIRSIAPHLKSNRFGFEPEVTALIARIPGIALYEVGVSYWGRTYLQGKKIGIVDGIRALFEIYYHGIRAKINPPLWIKKQ